MDLVAYPRLAARRFFAKHAPASPNPKVVSNVEDGSGDGSVTVSS
jgi:hypothetical protein